MLFCGFHFSYPDASQRFYCDRRFLSRSVDPVRIPKGPFDSVVYICDKGDPVGTGFCIGIPVEPGSHQVWNYVATARHVVRGRSDLTVRINLSSGRSVHREVFPLSWWISENPHADVALGFLPGDQTPSVPTVIRPDQIADNEFIRTELVGPGDDVISIGLLPELPGEERNEPIARFGHIAAAATDAIPHETPDGQTEALDVALIECTSFGGQSGSPVFVVFPPDRWMGTVKTLTADAPPRSGWALLGLMTGQWRIPQEIRLRGLSVDDKLTDNMRFFYANAGIALVTLGQHILDLLDRDDVLQDRQRRADRLGDGSDTE